MEISNKLNFPIKFLVRIIFSISLLILCSKMSINYGVVPITLQSVGIMIITLSFDLYEVVVSYFIYITLGILGFPVFANSRAGVAELFGVSFGYFIGFLLAIFIMHKIKSKFGISSFLNVFINCFIGTILICISGVTWLLVTFGIKKSIAIGFTPYIFPGILKALFSSLIIKLMQTLKVIFINAQTK